MHANHKDEYFLRLPIYSLNDDEHSLLAHGACSALASISLLGLGLGHTLGEDLSVLVLDIVLVWVNRGGVNKKKETYGLVLDLLGLATLESSAVALVLETLGSDQTLDAGSLGVGLLALTLGLDLATDNVLADLDCARRLH
jgi:hypothetical protein